MGNGEKIVYFSDLDEVKDVLEFASYGSFPETGEPGKIYVAKDVNRIYRWSEDPDGYVEISDAPANLPAAQGGTANSLVTTGDKWNWNNKVDSSALFATWYPDGSVTSEADFTQGLKFDEEGKDTVNRTIEVLPFCVTAGLAESSNSNLIGRVVIPPYKDIAGVRYTVTAIKGGYAAYGNNNLTAVVAPVTVTNIKQGAFSACVRLTSISFPGVTVVGVGAFEQCTTLTDVRLPAAITISQGAFTFSGVTSLTLPSAVTLGSEAFESSDLVSVNLPNVTTLGFHALAYCENLTDVALPSAVTLDSAFDRDTALTSLDLPKATTFSGFAFDECDALEAVSIPAVETIVEDMFAYCAALKTLTCPSVTSIEHEAFLDCTSLETIDFGNDLTTVPSLNNYTWDQIFPPQAPDGCKIIVPDALFLAWTQAPQWNEMPAAGYIFMPYSDRPGRKRDYGDLSYVTHTVDYNDTWAVTGAKEFVMTRDSSQDRYWTWTETVIEPGDDWFVTGGAITGSIRLVKASDYQWGAEVDGVQWALVLMPGGAGWLFAVGGSGGGDDTIAGSADATSLTATIGQTVYTLTRSGAATEVTWSLHGVQDGSDWEWTFGTSQHNATGVASANPTSLTFTIDGSQYSLEYVKAVIANEDSLARVSQIPAEVTVDATLTQPGAAADAKATGDALRSGYTEWVIVPSTYGGKSFELAWSSTVNGWKLYLGDSLVGAKDVGHDATSITFNYPEDTDIDVTVTATRHAFPPTKTSQLTNDGDGTSPFVTSPVFGAVNDGVDPSDTNQKITLVPGKCVRLAPTSSALTSIDLAMPPGFTTSGRECRLELDLSALPSGYARLPSITVYSDENGTVIAPPGRTIESVFFCPPGWKYYFTFHEVGPNVWMCERTGSTAPFDDRVAWIGNPGAAYCGTGIHPNQYDGHSMSIETTLQFENWTPRSYFTNWPVFCGSFDNLDVENRFHLVGFWGRSLRWQFGTSGNIDNIAYASVDYGEKFTVRQSIDTGAHSASGLMTCRRYTGQGTVNLATSSPTYTSTPPTAELYIFADHVKTASDDYAQDFFIGKCFGQVEITLDADKRIFVPVVAGGGRGAFYDVFNRQVLYSQGACEFDVGPVA